MGTKNTTLAFINGARACFGCGACAAACPKQALRMTPDGDGFAFPEIVFSKCVECGKCRRTCPVNAGPAPRNCDPEFYSVRHKERAIREKSTSGGAFTALSDAVLARGGAVAGAVWTQDFQVRHAVALDPAGRDAMRGSKYVQSDTSSVFPEVKKLLDSGREVLFSGTPCQVAALNAFLGESGGMEGLVTVDFICHGAPSPKVFQACLRELSAKQGSAVRQVRCRDGKLGCVPMRIGVDFADGSTYLEDCEHDPYFRLFLSGIINRLACAACPYTCVRRSSDLTIADNWRFASFAPEWDDNTGVSTLLVNTSRGAALLQDASDALEIRKCTLKDIDQHYLHRPGGLHPDRDLFFRALAKRGFAAAAADFTRPRPLWRKIRSRLLKLLGRRP